MTHLPGAVAQLGFPEWLPGLIGLAGTLVLLLMLAAFGGFVYKSLTGGVEWPDEQPEDDEGLQRGSQDDEWDFY